MARVVRRQAAEAAVVAVEAAAAMEVVVAVKAAEARQEARARSADAPDILVLRAPTELRGQAGQTCSRQIWT